MKIEVARSAGFCPGVRRAVDFAYDAIRDGDSPLWMYGPVVHNEHVIRQLLAGGAHVTDDIEAIPDGARVLIRAHGVGPEIHRRLKAKGCEVIDGTCPFVQRIHRIVADAVAMGRGVIVTGTPNHPEVMGIVAHAAPETPVLLETVEAAEAAEFDDRSWVAVSQTTFSLKRWRAICAVLENKIAKLEMFDTICNTTVQRQSDAKVLAASSDIVLVLGSRTSSNTAKLVDVCREACQATYRISNPEEVDAIQGLGAAEPIRVGVTTGASTPNEMIREVIYRMTTNEGMTKPEETVDVNFEDYVDSIPELQPRSIVRGRIVRYDDDYVYVDVKDKSEGKVPLRELLRNPEYDLDEAVKNHQEVDVYVRSIRNSDAGKDIMLSTGYVETLKHKEELQKAYDEKTPVTVKVVNVVRDGVIARYGSIDIYIHRTQLELSRVEDLEPYRDQTFDILITQFDPNRRRIRVSGSRRSLLQRERKASEREIWETIEVGNEYEGIVRNLTNFGAFVDIGGVDGLIHISELSWRRIRHPSEVLSVGDKVNVFVKDFERERKRISLGYRRKEDDPYRDIEARFPVGAIVRGVVVRMFPFGAFINIAPDVDALCHVSQISDYRLKTPSDVLVEGMEVDARVVEVSDEARRISVSIREVEPINPDPDSELVQQQQQARENRAARRRNRRRRDDNDGLPTSYVDNQATSSISDMAEFSTDSKDGSDLMDRMAALRDELQEAERGEETEDAEPAPEPEPEPESAAEADEEAPAEEAPVETEAATPEAEPAE